MDQGLTLGASPFVVHFPIFLLGVALFASLFVGFLSDWFRLARVYPNRRASPLRVMRFCSGRVGACNFVGCLRFEACVSGLRIAIFRGFAPLERPLFVPWRDILVQTNQGRLGMDVTLSLGTVSHVTVPMTLAVHLAHAAFKSWPAAHLLLGHPLAEPLLGVGAEDRFMLPEEGTGYELPRSDEAQPPAP